MTKKLNLANDVKTFLEEIEDREDKPLYEMTAEEARDFLLSVQRKNYVNIDAEVTDKTISSSKAEKIDIRIIRPKAKNEKLSAIIYAHGGGWIMGDKEAYDMLIKRLANEAECCVIFADYKKSPEHTYPSALNEICGVLEYVTKYPDEFNIDINKIALAGDSAGGNLAAAVCMKARDTGDFSPARQILIYPALYNCYTEDSPYESVRTNGTGYLLTSVKMEDYVKLYARTEEDRLAPYFAPLLAEDFSGLPDTLILTAEFDPLRDEGEDYGRKLREAGCRVRVERIEGALHGYFALGIQQFYVQESFRHINRFLSVEQALL